MSMLKASINATNEKDGASSGRADDDSDDSDDDDDGSSTATKAGGGGASSPSYTHDDFGIHEGKHPFSFPITLFLLSHHSSLLSHYCLSRLHLWLY